MVKQIQKAVALLLAMIILIPSTHGFAAPNSFKDVTSFKEEIEFLTNQEVIFGFPDGTFRPNDPILRVQAVQMLMRDIKPDLEDVPNPNFVDIKPGDRGYEDVAKAVQLGIINGKGNNRFDPQGKLTRAEMAIILERAYHLTGIYPPGFSDVSKSSVAYDSISSLAANNITVGYPDGTFKPSQTIDRAQFSAFMARIIEPSFQPDNPGVADSYLETLLDFDIIDYAMNEKDSIIYLLDASTNSVVAYNYNTYDYKSVKLSLPAEAVAFANNKIYVTQLKGKHSSVWWDEDQEGAFSVIDASTMKQERVINIDLDPFDIEADDKGIVYISSGSGQHTRIESYDSRTGKLLSSQRIYHRTYIKMNPSQTKVYSIDTAVSPRDIASYSINDGVLSPEKDSPYHGDYPLTTDLTISPDGKYLFNGTGNIFRASMVDSADMTYHASLDRSFTSIAFDVPNGELYTANNKKYIQAYDYTSLEPTYQLDTYGSPNKMFYDEKENTLLIFTKVKIGSSPVLFTGLEKIYFELE